MLKHRKLAFAGAIVGTLALVSSAFASHYSLFGDASIVGAGNPGNAAAITSDVAGAGYGGVDFSPSDPVAWPDLDSLGLDFNVTDDGCGGGSPRISLAVDTTGDGIDDGTVHVALGPSPSYTGCAAGWQSTGNLIGNEDAGRYDFSQFGGSPFGTYSGAPASVQAGDVVGAWVVVDGYWSAGASGGDNEQTVLVDNIDLDGHLTTFDPNLAPNKEACKKGGWMSFQRADFSSFKNQGDCIQYVNTGK